MHRYCFILNPTAGKGRGRLLKDSIEKYQEDHGMEYRIVQTEYPGHGELLSKAACRDGFDAIISVGGDGTLLEVINGIAEESSAVGLIPCGTGNDFARTIGLPSSVEAQLDVIRQGNTKWSDLGKANGRYFINVFSFGIDALITRETQKIKKYLPGAISYIAATLKMLMTYRPVDVTMDVDGEILSRKVMLVAFGNGAYYGGGMKIVPGASIDSGEFKICLVRELGKLKFLRLFPKVFDGSHIDCDVVEMYSAKRIKVKSDGKVYLNADGDVVGECPVDVGIVPKAIRVIVP